VGERLASEVLWVGVPFDPPACDRPDLAAHHARGCGRRPLRRKGIDRVDRPDLAAHNLTGQGCPVVSSSCPTEGPTVRQIPEAL
jgi:hypothetical protein